MFKKSIPAILGALLFGTSAEAIVITCPTTYEVNKAKIPPYEFKINAISLPGKILFENRSLIVRSAQGKTGVRCVYTFEDHPSIFLTFYTNYKCFIQAKEAKKIDDLHQTCNGSPACAVINCPT